MVISMELETEPWGMRAKLGTVSAGQAQQAEALD